MYVYDGKYWPAIRPSGQISALGSIGLLRIRSEGYRLEPGVGVTGTIDGKSIEFGWDHYESTDYSFPISGDETATASADAAPDGASFAIEPILFWAHEFGDIGPIYDTSTGEELQDRNKIIRRNGEYVRLP